MENSFTDNNDTNNNVTNSSNNGATIEGRVIDMEGYPLPGVTIILVPENGSPKVNVTDEDGDFRVTGLAPDIYLLKAELEGFKTVKIPDINAGPGDTVVEEITMQLPTLGDER